MATKKVISKDTKKTKSPSWRLGAKKVIFKSPDKQLAAEAAATELSNRITPPVPMLSAAAADQAVKAKPMLHVAEELINGQRQADYGDKLRNFTQIAMGVQMVLATKLRPGVQITAFDVGLIMNQVKIARLAKSPEHHDSLVDVAGYAGCLDKVKSEAAALTADFQDALDSAIVTSGIETALKLNVGVLD